MVQEPEKENEEEDNGDEDEKAPTAVLDHGDGHVLGLQRLHRMNALSITMHPSHLRSLLQTSHLLSHNPHTLDLLTEATVATKSEAELVSWPPTLCPHYYVKEVTYAQP